MALVEIDVADRSEPIRVLYTGDFCTHELVTLSGAGLPVLDGRIDALVIETVLAADAKADEVEYESEVARLREVVAAQPGPVLVGVTSVGESTEVAAVLEGVGKVVLVDEFLRPLFEAVGRDGEFGDRRRMREHLATGGVVIAPGDQLRAHSSGGRLLGEIEEDDTARVVVLNRAREKTPAGRLVRRGVGRGEGGQAGGASVSRHLLINHAPRWQLMAMIQGLAPRRTFLVHGTTGARWALKRALEGGGYRGDVVVVEEGEELVIGEDQIGQA